MQGSPFRLEVRRMRYILIYIHRWPRFGQFGPTQYKNKKLLHGLELANTSPLLVGIVVRHCHCYWSLLPLGLWTDIVVAIVVCHRRRRCCSPLPTSLECLVLFFLLLSLLPPFFSSVTSFSSFIFLLFLHCSLLFSFFVFKTLVCTSPTKNCYGFDKRYDIPCFYVQLPHLSSNFNIRIY